MATVSNCDLPEDLYYVVEKHVWARHEDGIVTVGLTDVAQNLAKGIISVSPKKVGPAPLRYHPPTDGRKTVNDSTAPPL